MSLFVNRIQSNNPYLAAIAATNAIPSQNTNANANNTLKPIDSSSKNTFSFTGAVLKPEPVRQPAEPIKVQPAAPVNPKQPESIAPPEAKENYSRGLAFGSNLTDVYAGKLNGEDNYLKEICIA